MLEQCGNSRVVEMEMQNAELECKQCATMSDVTPMIGYQCSCVHSQCDSTHVQLHSMNYMSAHEKALDTHHVAGIRLH